MKRIGNGLALQPWTATTANLVSQNPGNDAWSSWSSQMVATADWSGVSGNACSATFFAIVTAASGENSTILLEVGIDPAGGTSYTRTLTLLLGGHVTMTTSGSTVFMTPLSIDVPNGASMAWRAARRQYVARAVSVGVVLDCEPTGLVRAGTEHVVGVTAPGSASYGTAIAAGNAAMGSWTQIGTAAADLFEHAPLLVDDSTAWNAVSMRVDLGFGGTSSPARTAEACAIVSTTASEQAHRIGAPVYEEVATGEKLWMRVGASGAPSSTLAAAIASVGGAAPITGGGGVSLSRVVNR